MIKKIVLIYYYFFYKFYKFWEFISIPSFLSDFKAGISLIALEIWFLLSIGVYYSVLTKETMNLSISSPIVLIPLVLILSIKYYCFIYSNKWKDHIKFFDKLEKKKNVIGTWVVILSTFLIITNLIYSFFLMSQIDWSSYR